MPLNLTTLHQVAVVDPEFPREVANPYVLNITPISWQGFCRKLHESERNWTNRWWVSVAPLGSAMHPVADPGFPRGEGTNSLGGANIRFCQIFPKTA